jgi:hypothetical protein
MANADVGDVVVVAANETDLEVVAAAAGGESNFADLDDVDLTASTAGAVLVMNAANDGVETATSVIPEGTPEPGMVLASDEGTPTWVYGVLAVNHGAIAGTPRPTGALVVYWVGSVTPTEKEPQDVYYDTGA